jgi:hypothetical protein
MSQSCSGPLVRHARPSPLGQCGRTRRAWDLVRTKREEPKAHSRSCHRTLRPRCGRSEGAAHCLSEGLRSPGASSGRDENETPRPQSLSGSSYRAWLFSPSFDSLPSRPPVQHSCFQAHVALSIASSAGSAVVGRAASRPFSCDASAPPAGPLLLRRPGPDMYEKGWFSRAKIFPPPPQVAPPPPAFGASDDR